MLNTHGRHGNKVCSLIGNLTETAHEGGLAFFNGVMSLKGVGSVSLSWSASCPYYQ